MRSESINAIAKALSEAQDELAPAEMDSINPFLKNKYASLGSVIETIRPVLKKYGLSYTQIIEGQDGQIGLTTLVMHTSGEWIQSTIMMPLGEEKGKSLAQAAGGIITYLRRYSLSALFGVYAEEDTDAEKVRTAAKKEADKQEAPQPAKMSLETALAVKSSNGELYGNLSTETLSHMARSIAKKLNAGGYDADKTDEMKFKLDAIRVILASDRPEPGEAAPQPQAPAGG